MNDLDTAIGNFDAFNWTSAAGSYLLDRSQRSILFWDVLRQRGNDYLAHLEAGHPPVLVFDYEIVEDGRTFERPVNYSLLRIVDRRTSAVARPPRGLRDRRVTRQVTEAPRTEARPVVVIDPRAGHGPGIGGSKLNSQIGVALDFGHPVYFITFYTNPEPGQTISDIHQAEIRFLETVASRHSRAPKPMVIGNCQAGWATALIGADRPDVTGPMVLNGSPLSYWGGVEGANPMRYRGGLFGGVWLASMSSDLGNGRFDGAHLVAGFEDLNPANTFWSKLYNLFANVDTEEKRFLNFERWWGGFFKLNFEEIHFIVDSLFIGNELEQGQLRLDNGKVINLKNFKDPILIFASGGDNITPPPQALNWIYKVYGTVEEIKRCGQVIIYMVHETVGHLGIFVSGKVAKKEHREIIGCVDMLDYLAPGLYEMVIEGEPTTPWLDDYQVRFEHRDMADILTLDDGLEDEMAFYPVKAISRGNDWVYRNTVSPMVQAAVTEPLARSIRALHPLRVQRYGVSDLNPMVWPIQWLAKGVKVNRKPVDPENPFVAMEKAVSNSVEIGLNLFRDLRDLTQELWFKNIYSNDWMKAFFTPDKPAVEGPQAPTQIRDQIDAWLKKASVEGGFAEAVVRIILAVTGATRVLDKRQFNAAVDIIQSDPRLNILKATQYRDMIKEQAAILEHDSSMALAGLVNLLPTEEERRDALAIAARIAQADHQLDRDENVKMSRIQTILEVKGEDMSD